MATDALNHVADSMLNFTTSLVPSPNDLLWAIPRLGLRAGRVTSGLVPTPVKNFIRSPFGNSTTFFNTTQNYTEYGNSSAPFGLASVMPDASIWQMIKAVAGILSYFTSKWALIYLVVVFAINRIGVFAAARRHLRLPLRVRIAVRLIPILVLASQILSQIRAIRCQTSPNFSTMRYGIDGWAIGRDFSQDGGFLYNFGSLLGFWESELESCQAIGMVSRDLIPKVSTSEAPNGSLSTLWPAFLSISLSRLVDAMSCAVQGQRLHNEAGITLMEHSFALADTEGFVFRHVSQLIKAEELEGSQQMLLSEDFYLNSSILTKNLVFTRFNAPPETLFVTLLSMMSHISGHTLGIFNLQSRYRLISTGVWAIFDFISFSWALSVLPYDGTVFTRLSRLPSVWVFAFIPHLLLITGMALCLSIYGLALLLNVFAPPEEMPPNATWKERFRIARANMAANIHFRNVTITFRDDFYIMLLRIAVAAFAAATEAVYLKEGRRINVGPTTWLEEERLGMIQQSRERKPNGTSATGNGDAQSIEDSIAGKVILTDKSPVPLISTSEWQSGYARECQTQQARNEEHSTQDINLQGWQNFKTAAEVLFRISRLSLGWSILSFEKTLKLTGLRYRPNWWRSLLGITAPKKTDRRSQAATAKPTTSDAQALDKFMVFDLAKKFNVDIELETRRKMMLDGTSWGPDQEQRLDDKLYNWFVRDGFWGEVDTSGDYDAPLLDVDTTSVVTASDAASTSEWESDGENDDGRRTPTQQDWSFSREPTPVDSESLYDMENMIRLLSPKTPQERREARILSEHLASDRIVTRSRFEAQQRSKSTSVLFSGKYGGFSLKPTPEEEEELLEKLLIARRTEKSSEKKSEDSFAGGPQCVVCQGAPRTILAWPCRCLSLCEECRLQLASNQFATCICCRREVVGFSRLYVP